MIDNLKNLSNHLRRLGFKKESAAINNILKIALAPLGPIAIEALIATSPAWVPPAKTSAWVYFAGLIGVGAVGAGVAHSKAEEGRAKRRLKRLEKVYNREMSRNMSGGVTPDLDADEREVQFVQITPEELREWYKSRPPEVKAKIDEEVEGDGEVVWLPQPPAEVIDEDTDFDSDLDADLEYEEEDDEDNSPLDCNLLCWAEQIEGSDGIFSYHFIYNYEGIESLVRKVLGAAILSQDYDGIKNHLLPMELGRDDGILSRVHPSSFRRKFKNSDLKAAVCAMCVGGSYNIVYLSDTHKPKRTIEYDYDNPLFPNMSEERVHYIYFDPMLIKNMYQISGECKPISTRLLRLLE